MPAVSSIAIAALVVSVAGTVSAGIAARNQAKFQSEVAQQQADRAKLVAEANEGDFRRKISRQIATIKAAKGEISGSQLLSLEDFTAEAELDALTIRNQGVVQQNRLEQQASLFSASARNAGTATAFRSGAQLLTGFSSIQNKFGGSSVPDVPADSFQETDA